MNQTAPLQILLVDDDRDQHVLLTHLLGMTSINHVLTCASTRRDALAVLATAAPDVCLVDFKLGDERGSDLVRSALDAGSDAAMIMMTEYSDAAVSDESLSAGATDYIVKGQLNLRSLERTIRFAVERRTIVRELRASEGRLRAIISSAPVGIYSFDTDGVITFVEGHALEELRLTSSDIVGRTVYELFGESEIIMDGVRKVLAGETAHGRIDLAAYVFDCRCSPTRDSNGVVNGAVGVANDVTIRVRAEAERERQRDRVAASQRLFESFMANSSALTYIKNVAGEYVYVNDRYASAIGLSRDAAVGTCDADIWPQATADECAEQDRRLLSTSETQEFVQQLPLCGTPRTFKIVKFMVTDGAGASYICCKADDITESAHSRERLRKSDERFLLTARATDNVVYDLDPVTEHIWWNENLQKRYGHAGDHAGYDDGWFRSMLHPDDRDRVVSSLATAMATQQSNWSEEYRFQRGDGSYAFVLDRGYILYDGDAAIRVVGAMIDLSERHDAVEALKLAHESLELRVQERTTELANALLERDQSHRAQTRFVADASHDLRNPLTVVRAEIELLLLGDHLDDHTREALRRVESEARRLDRLSGDLLMLATLDGGVPEVERNDVRLDELVLNAIGSLSAIANDKLITWNVRIEDAVVCHCNQAEIQRALFNVLENAVKYSTSGAVVDVSLERVRSFAQFIVTDSGIGVPAADLPLIFDRFFRSDAARAAGGTGLGLPIVKTVVESHGGNVRVSSVAGAGTTVTIALPVSHT